MSSPPTFPLTLDVKRDNESKVFRVFRSTGEKLTVAQVHQYLVTNGERITERTVRRAINDLRNKNFLLEYGKEHGGAVLYGLFDTSYASSEGNEKIINFGNSMLTVEDFLKVIVPHDSTPFQRREKLSVLNGEVDQTLRRMFTFAVISAGNPGLDEQLKRVAASLIRVQQDLEYILNAIKRFLDSSVWYDQYRDKIAFELRELQKRDPELFQLASDFVRSRNDDG